MKDLNRPCLLILSAIVLTTGCANTSSPDEPAPGVVHSLAGPACQAEPSVPFLAFPLGESGQPRLEFVGTITTIEALTDLGLSDVTLATSRGVEEALQSEETLRVRLDDPSVFSVGSTLDVRVDYAPGSPAASALLVRDEKGLLFAGVSDQGIGASVLAEGIPGLEFSLEPSDCGVRTRSSCYESVSNLALVVRSGQETSVLAHGESARLGAFIVRCLVAQDVAYTSNCADAGLVRVSYTVRRVDIRD